MDDLGIGEQSDAALQTVVPGGDEAGKMCSIGAEIHA
jgi:hypothetical protein